MGVQSLTRFVQTKQTGVRMNINRLQGKVFYMDGNSLLYALSVTLDWRCGGELRTLRRRVADLCQRLHGHGISCHVYIDGSKTDLKQDTIRLRQQRRLQAMIAEYVQINQKGKADNDNPLSSTILPPTAMTVFIDELLKHDTKIFIVQGEADGVLCREAKRGGGFVCSDDSDCLIYDSSGMIFLRELLRSDEVHCYYRSDVAYSLDQQFRPEWMPIFATLCGNDYTRFFSDPIIRHITSQVRYGYFLVKIARYIIQHDGSLDTMFGDLLSVGAVTLQQVETMGRSIATYMSSVVGSIQNIKSLEQQYLYCMFSPAIRAISTGYCYLPIVPHDESCRDESIWKLTQKIREKIKALLPCDTPLVDVIPRLTSTDETIESHAPEPTSPLIDTTFLTRFHRATSKQQLRLMHWLIFNEEPNEATGNWYDKWKRNRMFALICNMCRKLLGDDADWIAFEQRIQHACKGKRPRHGTALSVSFVSWHYALFQIVAMHLNLLSGILGMYDRLPPFLDYTDGSTIVACS